MALVESIFDISYLSIVLALGVRLLVEKPKEAKSFGIMAIELWLDHIALSIGLVWTIVKIFQYESAK